MLCGVKSAALLLSGLFLVLLTLFGGSAFGGAFVADPTVGRGVLASSVLYERFGGYLAGGHYPWFMPEFGGGYPAAAAWVHGLLSPATALFALLPAGAAWTWSAILHLLLAGLGMFLFVRALTSDAPAAAVAAVIYVLSDYMIGRTIGGQLQLVWPAAWLPFVFLGLRRAARGEAGGMALAGLTLGLGLISGDGRLWCFLLPVVLLFAGHEVLRRPHRLRGGGRILAALAVAIAVSAVQWGATLEFTSIAKVSPEFHIPTDLSSARPLDLLGLAIPGALGYLPADYWGGAMLSHEFVAAGGLGVLFLVMLGICDRRRGMVFWLLTAVFGIVLALGAGNPVSRFLTGLSLFSMGEVFGRALLLTTFAFAVLAGLGTAGFRSAKSRRRLVIPAGILLLLVLWGAFLVLYGFVSRPHFEEGLVQFKTISLPAFFRGLFGLLLVGAGLWLGRRGPRMAIITPVMVAACVLITALPPVGSEADDAYTRDWAADLPEDARPHRMFVSGAGLYPNVERSGWRTLRPLSGLDTPWYVEALLSGSNRMHYWLDIRSYVRGMNGREGGWDEPPRPLRIEKLVWPVGRGLVIHEFVEGVPDDEVIHELGDWSRVLRFPGDAARASTEGLAAAEDAVEYLESGNPNRLAYAVRSTGPGWLYVAEKYYPFWAATVDGTAAPCQRVNLTGMAVPIPAGEHRVELSFAPASSRWGPLVSLLGVVFCALALARAARKARHPADDA